MQSKLSFSAWNLTHIFLRSFMHNFAENCTQIEIPFKSCFNTSVDDVHQLGNVLHVYPVTFNSNNSKQVLKKQEHTVISRVCIAHRGMMLSKRTLIVKVISH